VSGQVVFWYACTTRLSPIAICSHLQEMESTDWQTSFSEGYENGDHAASSSNPNVHGSAQHKRAPPSSSNASNVRLGEVECTWMCMMSDPCGLPWLILLFHSYITHAHCRGGCPGRFNRFPLPLDKS
jgi:hypothetical protein